MAFWSNNRINLKRNWLFLGEINFYSVQADTGLTSGIDGIVPFLIHSYQKPKLVTNINDYGGQNPLNGQWNYEISNVGWDALTIKVYDVFSGKQTQNSVKVIFDWLDSNGYDSKSFDTYVGGGEGGVPAFVTRLSNGNAATLSISSIDHQGKKIETFKYNSPILSALDFGDASYDSDSIPLITMKFNISSVEYLQGGGLSAADVTRAALE